MKTRIPRKKKKYRKKEFEKYKDSPYYLYLNYYRVNGKKVTLRGSKEDWDKLFKKKTII